MRTNRTFLPEHHRQKVTVVPYITARQNMLDRFKIRVGLKTIFPLTDSLMRNNARNSCAGAKFRFMCRNSMVSPNLAPIRHVFLGAAFSKLMFERACAS